MKLMTAMQSASETQHCFEVAALVIVVNIRDTEAQAVADTKVGPSKSDTLGD